MPVFNDEIYLNESIQSVLSQSLKDIELICVNDGSTDNSLNILQDFNKKYDFIKVLTQENQGAGVARNYGLSKAKGEYIAFLDADDIYIDNDALRKMFAVGKKYNADMISANLVNMGQNRKLINDSRNRGRDYIYFEEERIIHPDEYGIPWAFYKNIFKRELIEKNNIKFPCYLRGQDAIFLSKILGSTDEIYGVPIDFYGYRVPVQKRPNDLLNTSVKRLHFMKHYKHTFDILENKGLSNISKKYKKDLIKRLKYFASINDIEFYEYYLKVFGESNNHFNSNDDVFKYLHLNYLLNKLVRYNDEVLYDNIKINFSDFEIANNKFVNEELLRKFVALIMSDTFLNFKEEFLKIESMFLNKKVRNLKKKNKKLKKKRNSLKKLNKNLNNSHTLKPFKLLGKIKKIR